MCVLAVTSNFDKMCFSIIRGSHGSGLTWLSLVAVKVLKHPRGCEAKIRNQWLARLRLGSATTFLSVALFRKLVTSVYEYKQIRPAFSAPAACCPRPAFRRQLGAHGVQSFAACLPACRKTLQVCSFTFRCLKAHGCRLSFELSRPQGLLLFSPCSSISFADKQLV